MIEIVAGLAIGAAIAVIIRWFISIDRDRREKREFYRNEFFSSAERLLNEPSLNEDHIATIKNFTTSFGLPGTFRTVFCALSEKSTNHNIVYRVPADVKSDWYTMAYAWIMATTYDGLISGVWMRALLAVLLDPSRPEAMNAILDRQLQHA